MRFEVGDRVRCTRTSVSYTKGALGVVMARSDYFGGAWVRFDGAERVMHCSFLERVGRNLGED